ERERERRRRKKEEGIDKKALVILENRKNIYTLNPPFVNCQLTFRS
ncbi:MAG: hypothetical protein HC849_27375, partial [Oscillatoriales cyanobacterium RU_3_3]|nr:hypothetical protein [Oscillatoriales cyanobacterium RU_3_3]